MSVTERPHPSTICDASQVRGDMIGGSGTGRCVNTDPLLPPSTRLSPRQRGGGYVPHILGQTTDSMVGDDRIADRRRRS